MVIYGVLRTVAQDVSVERTSSRKFTLVEFLAVTSEAARVN